MSEYTVEEQDLPSLKRDALVGRVLADAINDPEGRLATLVIHRDELLASLKEIMSTHDEDIGMDEFDDDESVGAEEVDGKAVDMKLTFGMLRRARALISKIEAAR